MCAACWVMMAFSLVLSLFAATVYGGSCRDATLCCNGRDSSCVVQKAFSNTIVATDLNVKPCYCDHACLKLGDCCADFKAYCGVIDCVASEWGPWAECDTPCGPGMTSRNRTVRQKTQNGGKHCPSLVQKRGCLGTDCHSSRNRPALLQETALLLPVATLSARSHKNTTTPGRGGVSSTEDIQRLRNPQNTFHEHKPATTDGYCIAFLLMKVTKQCQKDPNYRALLEGDRIVVHCDLEPPFTRDVTSDEQDNSVSEESNEDDGNDDENGNTNIDDYDRNLPRYASSSSSSSSRKVPNRTVPNRCLGEGITGRNTRFASLVTPACHGKWLRLTGAIPKKCFSDEAQFIFI
ncbi:somatomedin-B and thrombospondin type-1 domain-containing protein-like [Armigeres subalbatus]|uniref:somatomedin-B and thrombospondin type-1 domain-containing protein-like n=1 Tax=Armigeres subalbatus TaxID=124917 RepID=UPI002ED3C9ED